jgi:hypothetical protein
MDTEKRDQIKHNHREKEQDVETASEIATPPNISRVDTVSRQERREVDGGGIGITALILSLLSFFLFPFILSALGIVLGIVGVQRGSTAGWWAIGIGAFVLLIRILVFPITAIF